MLVVQSWPIQNMKTIGFVVRYGRYSAGGNQMLVKLTDASVERLSKRSADLPFSDILYNVAIPRTSPEPLLTRANQRP